MTNSEEKKKKILVVDDETNIRLLYREELEDTGYEVLLAQDAEEAFQILGKETPDLITVDIKMPGMNGIDFLNKVKETHKDVPVILCSAYGSYKQDFRVWASDAYVVKSADLQELKLAIKEVLNY
ncbi:MAG: response regulator [Nitrospinaceae bacterium]